MSAAFCAASAAAGGVDVVCDRNSAILKCHAEAGLQNCARVPRVIFAPQMMKSSGRSQDSRTSDARCGFGEIWERLRQRLASRYLRDERLLVQQIAWLLGYSESGAFSHAYRRWPF